MFQQSDARRHACRFAAVALATAAWAFGGDYNYDFVGHPVTGVNVHGIGIINCPYCGPGGGGRAFYYRNRVVTPLRPPGMPLTSSASDITAVALNNRDEILVRVHNTASGQAGYYLYEIDHDLYRLVSNRGWLVSNPNIQDFRLGPLIALNDNDEVLAGFGGWVHANTPNGVATVAGLAYGKPALGEPGLLPPLTPLSAFTPLPRPPCTDNLSYSAMNNRHQVTGTCVLARNRATRITSSFIETGNDFAEVSAPGARWTQVTAINNAGVVVGYFQPMHVASDHRAFLFDGTHYTVLLQGIPPCPHAADASAYGVSDSGLVSGSLSSGDEIGFIAIPITGEPACRAKAAELATKRDTAPAVAARPLPPPPPAASGIVTQSYVGFNPQVKEGVLSFTVRSAGAAERTLSFNDVLPVGQTAGGNPRVWIARDAQGYVMFTILSPSMVSGVRVPEKMGEQTYEQARGRRQ